MPIYLGFFIAQIIIFEWVEKGFKTQNFETQKCFLDLKILFSLTIHRISNIEGKNIAMC